MTAPTESVTRTELITREPSEALAGLLGIPAPTETLPTLWHWIHLLERRPHADLGPDGHPTSGLPAPPGPGRKRMYAGGRVTSLRELRFGEEATRFTRVTNEVEKEGRTGALTFVTLRHEISQGGELAIVDEHDIVYRAEGSSVAFDTGTLDDQPPPPPREPALTLRVDEALLFRFSALTYNAHRIHYDHNWVAFEGYDDLVVHGPLQALMMGELHRREGQGIIGRQFAYRLVSPMIGPQTLSVVAAEGGVELGSEVLDVHGRQTATGRLEAAAETVAHQPVAGA